MLKVLTILLPFLGFGACTALAYPFMSGFHSDVHLGPANAGDVPFEITQNGRHLLFFQRSALSPLCTQDFGPVVPDDLSLQVNQAQRPVPQEALPPDQYYVNAKACGRALISFEAEVGTHQLAIVRTSTPTEYEYVQIRHHPPNGTFRTRMGIGIFLLCLALSMALVMRNPD